MSDDPIAIFTDWLAEASASEPNDPNAMALATVDANGAPSVRMVLLKDHGPDGFVFYTNLESRKGEALAANPRAALLFHWKSLQRQVRIEGAVSAVSAAEADAYFASRARDSRIGAWASAQSGGLDSRETFMARFDAVAKQYPGDTIPRPPHWSGFRVTPERIELWQDVAFRLHERRLFIADGSGGWGESLLYP